MHEQIYTIRQKVEENIIKTYTKSQYYVCTQ